MGKVNGDGDRDSMVIMLSIDDLPSLLEQLLRCMKSKGITAVLGDHAVHVGMLAFTVDQMMDRMKQNLRSVPGFELFNQLQGRFEFISAPGGIPDGVPEIMDRLLDEYCGPIEEEPEQE